MSLSLCLSVGPSSHPGQSVCRSVRLVVCLCLFSLCFICFCLFLSFLLSAYPYIILSSSLFPFCHSVYFCFTFFLSIFISLIPHYLFPLTFLLSALFFKFSYLSFCSVTESATSLIICQVISVSLLISYRYAVIFISYLSDVNK